MAQRVSGYARRPKSRRANRGGRRHAAIDYDTETYSALDLKRHGAYRYACHASTEVRWVSLQCCAQSFKYTSSLMLRVRVHSRNRSAQRKARTCEVRARTFERIFLRSLGAADLIRQHPGQRVRDATCRVRDDDFDVPCCLRPYSVAEQCDEKDGDSTRCQMQKLTARKIHDCPFPDHRTAPRNRPRVPTKC
jgi:hypothetical protein